MLLTRLKEGGASSSLLYNKLEMEVSNMIPKFKAWDKIDKVIREVTAIDWSLDLVEFMHGAIERSFGNVILMQSTEINGLEISDGDIVHVLDSEQINQRDENGAYIDTFFEEIDEIDSVVFVDGCFKLKRTGFDVCICRSVGDFKVIGNIYENPELLEVES